MNTPKTYPSGFRHELVKPSDIKPEPVTWLWKPFLAKGLTTLFYGCAKAGKSTLMHHLLKNTEKGGNFLTGDVPKANVLYVTEESPTLWAARFDRQGPLPDNVLLLIKPCPVRTPETWEDLMKDIKAIHEDQIAVSGSGLDLVILDPLSDVWPIVDENDAAQVGRVMAPLNRLASDLNLSMLCIHHPAKGLGIDVRDAVVDTRDARGSGALIACVDLIARYSRFKSRDEKDRRRNLLSKGRVVEDTTYIVAFDQNGMGFKLSLMTTTDPHALRLDQVAKVLLDDYIKVGAGRLWFGKDIWPLIPAVDRPTYRTLRDSLDDEKALEALGIGIIAGPKRTGGRAFYLKKAFPTPPTLSPI